VRKRKEAGAGAGATKKESSGARAGATLMNTKSSGAGAMFMNEELRSWSCDIFTLRGPEIIQTVARHVDDPEQTFNR